MNGGTRMRRGCRGAWPCLALIVATLVLPELPTADAQEVETVERGPPVAIDAAGAKLLPDGTLLLPDGEELVLNGLDVGLGLAPATKDYLRELTALRERHGPWRLIGAARDRHRRLSGRLETLEGIWIQERLLHLGLARFAGGISDAAERRALLEAERTARDAWRGIWRTPRYFVRPADDPDGIYNGFQIVQGRVTDVGRGDGVVFLNFGADWRSDFTAGVTVRMEPGDLPAGADGAPLSVFDLEGRMLRLRGVVRRYNGPYMEIAAPDQIELMREGQPDPVRLRSAGPSGPRPVSGSTL